VQIFEEFTALAIQGLNRQEARRVAKALDCAIMFGAIEHASGNESLQDILALKDELTKRMDALSKL